MSDLQISQVLAQIRALSQQVRPQVPAPGAAGGATVLGLARPASGAGPAAGAAAAPAPGSSSPGVSAFATLLKSGIDQVNQMQQQANMLAYLDVFWLLSMLCFCLVPLVFLMRGNRPGAGPAMAH